jgi:hypothetical protein
MCSEDHDYAEVWCEGTRKARKEHRCEECWRAIPAGTTYVYVSGIYDRAPFSHKIHQACEDLRGFIEDVVCGGHGQVLIGELEEEIHEAGQYIDCDHDAWEAAGLEPPNPLREVFDFIRDSYPAVTP